MYVELIYIYIYINSFCFEFQVSDVSQLAII